MNKVIKYIQWRKKQHRCLQNVLEWKYKAAENEHFQMMAVLDIDLEVFIFHSKRKAINSLPENIRQSYI